tara:strand:- start:2681 stop:3298 length:618 start_codon:yes stop_codon:yes gene_type:complete
MVFEFFSLSARSETNSSSVTNSVSPTASSTTTGGSSINYQTNQSFSNDVGVGPGIVCRTPSLNIGTSYANSDTTNWASIGDSGTMGDNISANIGIVIPFGSQVHDSCKRIASQTALDKQISTQLSMIRACASLQKEGIYVDANKFPLLKDCNINFGEPEIVKTTPPKISNLAKLNNNRRNNTVKNTKAIASNRIPKKIPKLISPL